jgi:MinD-like ATPase involved in chromosome partitioning or flagellar assembly
MSKIISVHSFRGGTGKSNTSANLAAILAQQGKRVCVVDTDIQSPGIHIILGLGDEQPQYALNDYLFGECTIEQAALDMTPRLGVNVSGRVFLIPSSTQVGEITRALRGYDVDILVDGYEEIIARLDLDVLIIDTHPGLNNETLMSVSVSDALVIMLRPDHQDYQGTAVVLDVSRRLGVEKIILVANKIPQSIPLSQLKQEMSEQYQCEVGATLPHSDDMMILGSQGVFALHYPSHFITKQLNQLAAMLV